MMKFSLPILPIHSVLPELRKGLAEHRSVVLSAEPGSGKTTIAPLALLDEPWLASQKIIILEPRRLAARMAAKRMSELAEDTVGGLVGYRIRFDRKISSRTRIEVVTEGILTRMMQQDPEGGVKPGTRGKERIEGGMAEDYYMGVSAIVAVAVVLKRMTPLWSTKK